MSLDLRQFVRTALLDVLGGIRDAQADDQVGRFIAPVGIGHVDFPADGGVVHQARLLVTTMKFDIAVTAETKSDAAGAGKVGISVLGASLSGATSDRAANNSRIQFAVPLKFPRYAPPGESED